MYETDESSIPTQRWREPTRRWREPIPRGELWLLILALDLLLWRLLIAVGGALLP